MEYTSYKVVLESDNWQVLNWLFSYLVDYTDYTIKDIEYLNVGNSQIRKMSITSFTSSKFALDLIRSICAYYGKDLSAVKISLWEE